MATINRINEALTSDRMGDVEKYFSSVTNLIDANSGVNDFRMISSDCYNSSCPVTAQQFTFFHLTDPSCDIIDISKGFITLDLTMDVQFMYKDASTTAVHTNGEDSCKFFIGFKSASHIIDVYNIYSNGRLTNCKQTKAKHEQTIVYNEKAKEEKAGRPGMYSPHKKVLEMNNCVCGTYIDLPKLADKDTKKNISMQIVMQIDDLLPLSSLKYYPRFLTGELELQLSCNLIQNMVWCKIPFENIPMKNIAKTESSLEDCRFQQCGDYAEVNLAYSENTTTYKPTFTTIIPSNLQITSAKSFVYGFNIKTEAKKNLVEIFNSGNFVVPAQWVEHYTFSQLPNPTNIRCNSQITMSNACQLVITFPNTSNQLTVSRNPHLEAVQVQVGDRIVPDKFFNTLDRAHCEMILSGLCMDSLFSAADELLESLTKNRLKAGTFTVRRNDDSDYVLCINLERFGSGCFCDGMSGLNIPINLNANFMEGTSNPHYYVPQDISASSITFERQPINLFIVSDAFWIFGPDGGEFIKDN